MIADLHLDALLDVLERRELGDDDAFAQRHLPMLEAAGVRVQVLPAFVDDRHLPESALRVTIQQLDAARREADRSDGRLRIVERAVELREAIADGAIAGILSLEGVEALGRDPSMIRALHRLGVRMAGLTWNRANVFADGLAEQTGAGITGLGFQLLDEMGQLGMALDLSHLSPRGCELALERYAGPVLASHSNAEAVFANPRNLADDVLAGVGERGGVVGLCAIPAFVGPGDPAQRLAEHHHHIVSVGGADAVAFGADFCGFFGDGIDPPLLPEQPSDVDTMLARQPEPPRETFYGDVLSATGQPDDGALAWGNAVRFLEGVLA